LGLAQRPNPCSYSLRRSTSRDHLQREGGPLRKDRAWQIHLQREGVVFPYPVSPTRPHDRETTEKVAEMLFAGDDRETTEKVAETPGPQVRNRRNRLAVIRCTRGSGPLGRLPWADGRT